MTGALEGLTETQARGLIELRAACDEGIRLGGQGWVRAYDLCGTKDERSAANMRSMLPLGLVEGRKPPGLGQTQWRWRITEAGRAFITGGTDA